jgi:hypothetical protein
MEMMGKEDLDEEEFKYVEDLIDDRGIDCLEPILNAGFDNECGLKGGKLSGG